MNVDGAHALVTGGTRGIGLELCRELLRRGADVTIAARNAARLARVSADLGARELQVDLSDIDQAAGLIGRAEESGGPVDILVNNAGQLGVTPMSSLDGQVLREQMVTNLLSPLELMRSALPGMLSRRSGSIVNIGSVAGDTALATQVGYCTSKSGLTTATRVLQRELGGEPVNALLVVLGLVDTDMTHDVRGDPIADALLDRFGSLRALDPAEIAPAVVDAIEKERRTFVLPRIAAPMHHLGALPTRLTDALLFGIPKSSPTPTPSGGNA